MATATKTAKATAKKAVPAKTTKKASAAKAAPEKEAPKQRGRARDEAEESRLLSELLKSVTIDGEGVRARVTGIGEAAAGITLDSGKSLDPTRAKMIILRHLAKEANENVRPTAALIAKARDEKHLSWAQIDAAFGTSRNESLKLYGDFHNDPDAWRKRHLVTREGSPGMRERKTKATSSNGTRAAVDAQPVFSGDEAKPDIISRIEGKNIVWNGHGKYEGTSFKAKVAKVTKVGSNAKVGKVVQFTDANGTTRQAILSAIVKVGGR